MIYALNENAFQVIVGLMKTGKAQTFFLNSCATNRDEYIVYYARDMINQRDTVTAYLVESKATNRNIA